MITATFFLAKFDNFIYTSFMKIIRYWGFGIPKWIKEHFFHTIYIQIWKERVSISWDGSSEIFDERPYIAIGKDNLVVKAIGNEAYFMLGSTEFEVSNPFSHSRLFINDFNKAEMVLRYGIEQLFKTKTIIFSPIIIIHPREKLDGGITNIECRLFKELSLSIGAREAYVHAGEVLLMDNFDIEKINETKCI